MSFQHTSVMPAEVAHYLDCRPGQTVVDGTLGGAGHARDMCRRIRPDGILVGVDRDADALRHAKTVLEPLPQVTIHLVRDSFANLDAILEALHISTVDRMLLDLGVSQHQLKNAGRGFSFMADEPLDMRMDNRQTLTASHLVNKNTERELAHLLRTYGEERRARRIARRIVEHRKRSPVRTARELADIISGAIPRKEWPRRLHPATRSFMALRIAVNGELEQLERFLNDAPELLNPGGRLCVLSFHSLEDRIVKQRMRALASPCTCPPALPRCGCGKQPVVRLLTRRVVKPGASEIAANPMARSTRLRAMERLPKTGNEERR